MEQRSHKFQLTHSEKTKLLAMINSGKQENRFDYRARIILLSAEGRTLDQIVEITGKSRPVVNNWRKRFREKGINGLKDARRRGNQYTVSPEKKH